MSFDVNVGTAPLGAKSPEEKTPTTGNSVLSPTNSSLPTTGSQSSPRASTDSRTTVISESLQKLSLKEEEQQSLISENHPPTTKSHPRLDSTATVTPNTIKPTSTDLSPNKKSKSAISSSQSSTAASNQTPDGSATDNCTSAASRGSPGLLTVKIYNSINVQLPVKINNNKQILHALAVNANHELTVQQIVKNLEMLDLLEETTLNPEVSLKYLPSIITIPNGDNLVKSLLYLTVEFENNALVIEPQKGTVNQSTWNQVVSFDVTKALSNSSTTLSNFLNLNLFIRLPNLLIPDQEKLGKKNLFTNSHSIGGAPSNSDETGGLGNSTGLAANNDSPSGGANNPHGHSRNIGDLLIGTIKLPLNLRYHQQPIRLMNHQYLKFSNYNEVLNGSSGNESLNKNSGPDDQKMGDIMLTIDFKPSFKDHLTINDFDLLKVIGKGSFGKVMQVVKKDTKQIYALKTLRKQHIVSRMEVTHTLAERTVLARINNPFIVPLKFSFQSPEKLYLVLSFVNGGELFWHLQREGKFLMDRSRFYTAELLTALESLHEMNVIYRDLKPENILLDYQGHIALCDFGLCKLNMSDKDTTNTFCGTPEYLAPELLLNEGYTRSVDWWTLGTLLYEMLTGLPPFYDDNVKLMYQKILHNPLVFPKFLKGTDAEDLLIKLLQKDPKNRLNSAGEIKAHPFFKDIDWQKLLNKTYLPPFKPNVENLLDTLNFDSDFTNEKPQDSVVDDFLSESVQKQFGGWTYNGDTAFN
ncbi:uncharacterized protein KQ657_000195 [Scheffersomyces spartinae]|uniref:non-specific serine/threonine protein kinase n=1 Tax=Scheffersomyces spartinae TaxID=45513 RepID=A0A9P7VDJ3_9ASCO|nr:uncharacterized protein KQ657_000195 [Scheffersomyces spartinae]KAG7196183.1 hypothetical protein KQ657_000195 [Scheffersomyces spartinae]